MFCQLVRHLGIIPACAAPPDKQPPGHARTGSGSLSTTCTRVRATGPGVVGRQPVRMPANPGLALLQSKRRRDNHRGPQDVSGTAAYRLVGSLAGFRRVVGRTDDERCLIARVCT